MRIRSILNVMLTVWLLAGFARAAEGDQFYFLAKRAPADSMTGTASSAVYLRWGVVEGTLPDDIDRFVLKRDGTELGAFSARTTMNEIQIAALYAGVDQARRRTEMTAWLGCDASSLGHEIYRRLHDANASMWGMLASRIDFNVARARYRGYLDTTTSDAQSYTYELLAENNASGTPQYVRVGLATVPAGSAQLLPKVSDFEQVHDVGRCDAPERFKEHGTLYLNWSHPGGNRVEQYGNALMTAGYDLYCTTTDAHPASPVDIAALAAGGSYDENGTMLIGGLEKLNDQPITISAKVQDEARYKGWNPPFSQFMMLPSQLESYGIHPGDKRYCYLVARDFTGNYGETSDELDVTIPDMTPPPAPWNVWTTKYTFDNTFRLAWLNTDVGNYYAEHKLGRKYCNLPTARLDKRLEWVDPKGSCDTNATRGVALNPQEYLVYRFDSVEAAQRFKDSDGDGYSDVNESAPVPGATLLSLPGTACEYNAAGTLPYPNYLVGRIAAVPQSRIGGKAVVEFNDTEVPLYKGKFYWYRIATKDADGQISTLSQPVRAFFPKRQLPPRPSLPWGTEHCDFNAWVTSTGEMPGEPPHPLFFDHTGKAAYGVLGCQADPQRALLTKKLSWYGMAPLQEHKAYVNAYECAQMDALSSRCGSEVQARFYAADGTLLASTDFIRPSCMTTTSEAGKETSEPSHTVSIGAECGGSFDPIDDGTVTDDPIFINPVGMTDCIKVGYRVNGVYYLEGTHCPPFNSPLLVDVPHFGGGEVCVEYEAQNANAESSVRYRGPCVIRPLGMKVFAPQAVSIVPSATTATATLVWAPPKQAIVATMLEWYRKGGGEHHSKLVPFDGNLTNSGTQSYSAAITPPPAGSEWQEEWCFRARTLGKNDLNPDDAFSEWSDEVCAVRQPEAAALPQYIPWPKVDVPGNEGNYTARYFKYDGLPVIELSDAFELDQHCGRVVPDCLYGTNHCLVESQLHGDCDLCSELRNALGDAFAFVVYRQESVDGDEANAGSYYQVSPLIDRLYCPEATRVEDPYVTLVHYRVGDDVVNEHKMVFKDLFPHEVGKYYRYQIVHFDQKGEITGYKQTNWIQAVAP